MPMSITLFSSSKKLAKPTNKRYYSEWKINWRNDHV